MASPWRDRILGLMPRSAIVCHDLFMVWACWQLLHAGIARSADAFRSADVRQTTSDVSRSDGGIVWMERIEDALGSRALTTRMTSFFNAATTLSSDPSADAPRQAMMEEAESVAQSFSGELLRIRYFSRLGVPAQVTLTTFIYERALDLLVITALSLGAAHLIPLFGVLATVVLCLVLALCLVACLSPLQRAAIAVIDRALRR